MNGRSPIGVRRRDDEMVFEVIQRISFFTVGAAISRPKRYGFWKVSE